MPTTNNPDKVLALYFGVYTLVMILAGSGGGWVAVGALLTIICHRGLVTRVLFAHWDRRLYAKAKKTYDAERAAVIERTGAEYELLHYTDVSVVSVDQTDRGYDINWVGQMTAWRYYDAAFALVHEEPFPGTSTSDVKSTQICGTDDPDLIMTLATLPEQTTGVDISFGPAIADKGRLGGKFLAMIADRNRGRGIQYICELNLPEEQIQELAAQIRKEQEERPDN